MTTEQNNLDNVIDEVQAELDVEQGLSTSTEDTLSIAQVQALMEGQKDEFQKQLDATRSHADRAVNAVRRDYESSVGQKVDDRLNAIQQEQGRLNWWNALDDEDQQKFAPIMQQLEELEKAQSPQTPEQEQAPENPNTDAQWQQVYHIVRSFGLDPQNQGIQYAVLSDPNMTPQQRQDAFLQNLGTVVRGGGGSGQQPQQSGQQPPPVQQNGVNPPIEQGGQATGSLRTPDDVRDAFITGTISTDQYRERMNALGQPI
jgi:hypothetical protein